MNPLLIYLSIPCLFIYPHYPQADLARCIIDTSYGRGESISSIIIHSFILPKDKNFTAPVCQDFCEGQCQPRGVLRVADSRTLGSPFLSVCV